MKSNKLFIVWGALIILIVGGLTVFGFMLRSRDENYAELEDKILDAAKKYVDAKFLYPEEQEVLKVTKEEMVENDFLDDLKYEDDACTGYVAVKLDGVYKYEAYIKCNKYTTKGYK